MDNCHIKKDIPVVLINHTALVGCPEFESWLADLFRPIPSPTSLPVHYRNKGIENPLHSHTALIWRKLQLAVNVAYCTFKNVLWG